MSPRPRRTWSLTNFNLDRELPDRPPVFSRLPDDVVDAIHVHWLPALTPAQATVIDGVFWGRLPLREVARLLHDRGLTPRVIDAKDVARIRDAALRALRPKVVEWVYATRNADLIRRHQLAEKRGVWAL